MKQGRALLRLRTMRTLSCLLLILALTSPAAARDLGILGQAAPPLDVDTWVSLPDGTAAPDVASLRGEVVYLFFFQSWCPGCHSHGFPALKEVRAALGDRVQFVAVQTVFEGFESNTPDDGRTSLARHDLDIPLAQSGLDGRRSTLMRSYRSGGTPWTVIIDRDGVVRFNDFRASPSSTLPLIKSLLKSKPTSPSAP